MFLKKNYSNIEILMYTVYFSLIRHTPFYIINEKLINSEKHC